MSDQVSGQFRKWVGLDTAIEQMVYTVWSVYCKHSYIERVILIAVYILCVDNDATLSTYYVCYCYNYICGEYNYIYSLSSARPLAGQ